MDHNLDSEGLRTHFELGTVDLDRQRSAILLESLLVIAHRIDDNVPWGCRRGCRWFDILTFSKVAKL